MTEPPCRLYGRCSADQTPRGSAPPPSLTSLAAEYTLIGLAAPPPQPIAGNLSDLDVACGSMEWED